MADSWLKSLVRSFVRGRPVWALNGGTFGYADGGDVTQQTNKTTAFTLNAITGRIVFAGGALAGWTNSSAQWTNSFMTSFMTAIFNQNSGTRGAYTVTIDASDGVATIWIWNNSSASLTESPAFEFTLFAGTRS